MGMRGRNSPVLSWQVKPAWNPKTWKERQKETVGGRERGSGGQGRGGKKTDMEIKQCIDHTIYWIQRKKTYHLSLSSHSF